MKRYEIVVTRAAERNLSALPPTIIVEVDQCIRKLADDPRPPGCKKLQGQKSMYRVRVGDYRIIYEVHDGKLVVVVITIGNRREIYQILKRR